MSFRTATSLNELTVRASLASRGKSETPRRTTASKTASFARSGVLDLLDRQSPRPPFAVKALRHQVRTTRNTERRCLRRRQNMAVHPRAPLGSRSNVTDYVAHFAVSRNRDPQGLVVPSDREARPAKEQILHFLRRLKQVLEN